MWIRKLTAWFWRIVMHRVCDFSDLSDTFTASSLQYNSYQILLLLFLFPTHTKVPRSISEKKKNQREAESRAVAGWMRLHQPCLMFYLQQNVGSRLALNSLGKHMLSLGNSSKDEHFTLRQFDSSCHSWKEIHEHLCFTWICLPLTPSWPSASEMDPKLPVYDMHSDCFGKTIADINPLCNIKQLTFH